MSPTAPLNDQSPHEAMRAATTLALWGAAVAGGVSADSTIDALTAPGMPRGARADSVDVAEICGLPAPGDAHASPAELISVLRRGGAPRLVLPVPGDMRGLPVGAAVALAALSAGALVALPSHGVALVPVNGHWRAYACDALHRAVPHRDALQLVDGAIRDATAALDRLDVARTHGDPRERIRREIISAEVPLPPGVPHTAASLLARSITLQAVLTVAASHETAAATARDFVGVDRALAPLAAAVRESRRTAVALAVDALHPSPARSIVGFSGSNVTRGPAR